MKRKFKVGDLVKIVQQLDSLCPYDKGEEVIVTELGSIPYSGYENIYLCRKEGDKVSQTLIEEELELVNKEEAQGWI
jgi:hypothetical protein